MDWFNGMKAPVFSWNAWNGFLRSDATGFHGWMEQRQRNLVWLCTGVIVIGCSLYGAVIGMWWAPLQALYAAIKLPLLLLLTALGNGLLNGMLAPLLGLRLGFRQSLTAVLVSFAVTSAILGALSPVAMFLVWNTPALTAGTRTWSPEYCFLQLMLAAFVACAGVAGNVRLLPLLETWANNRSVARKVLFAWLAGNLFLGSQICWVLRPFIWDQSGQVRFIGEYNFQGNFFETVFAAFQHVVKF